MRPGKFLKEQLNRCNPLCANGIGKSKFFLNSGNDFALLFHIHVSSSRHFQHLLCHSADQKNLVCSPANPSLLGLNIGGGAEVKLRLRRPNNELDFFPYDQILDTMLHELCHNRYGPHNADFYNLLDEIRKVVVYLSKVKIPA